MLSQVDPALYYKLKPMKNALICTYALATVAATACSHSAPPAAPPVRWTIVPLRSPITSSPDTVVVQASIAPGWHVYSLTQPAGGPVATRVTLSPGQPFELAGTPVSAPAPHVAYDDAFKMNVQLYEARVRFLVPVRASRAVMPADSVRVNVRYQICNASLCYPPQKANLAAAIPAPRT